MGEVRLRVLVRVLQLGQLEQLLERELAGAVALVLRPKVEQRQELSTLAQGPRRVLVPAVALVVACRRLVPALGPGVPMLGELLALVLRQPGEPTVRRVLLRPLRWLAC